MEDRMEVSLIALLMAATLRAGTPILLAALGELLAERAGILNLGVEGMMLVGALTGFIVSQQSGEPWVGLFAALSAGGAAVLQLPWGCLTSGANECIVELCETFSP